MEWCLNMSEYIRYSKEVDVMLLAEGTYPYVRGGVSSWISQLIIGLSDIKFGICFIGSKKSEYGEIRYDLPNNLVHLEINYIFNDDTINSSKAIRGKKYAFETIYKLHNSFKLKEQNIPNAIKNIDFFIKDITFKDFLHSKLSWEYINKKYQENCPDLPFIDYFWTLRNIHRPIWTLAKIVKKLPKTKLFHSPSTGYAGFLGMLASYNADTPFILTEHGIYTRERKIDMLKADWIKFQKSNLLKQPEELNYIKQMWVNFFIKIGEFAYDRAELILSLYPGAQKIQIQLGAKKEKTQVVPNGVDVDSLRQTITTRQDPPQPVITLIGRVVPIKDIKTFIRAIKITNEKIQNLEAWIVGPTEEDEEYFQECKQMTESLGLDNTIKFLGFQNIKEILPKSAIQTLTSISEGMPLVILEGFAAGVPCVATNVGSCEDLIYGALDNADIELGAAGAITNIASPLELAKQYIYFLSDFQAWKKAQKIALERVERYYREDLFLKKYRDIYFDFMKRET